MTRPRGAAWSARLLVTQEIVGSSPIGGAYTSGGQGFSQSPWNEGFQRN